MTTNLQKARDLLDSGNYTCVVCRDELIHTATARGVAPLLHWLDSGLDLTDYSAADRVVGRGAAFLYCLLGVAEVYAKVMSHPAAEVLRMHGITIQADIFVDGIINRKGDGPCPFEAAVMDILDPRKALIAIRHKRSQMQKGN